MICVGFRKSDSCLADGAFSLFFVILLLSKCFNVDQTVGDSGSSLFTKHNGVNVLIGVASWGDGCVKPIFPGII